MYRQWDEVKEFIGNNQAPYSYATVKDENGNIVKYVVSAERTGLVIQCAICPADDPIWAQDFETNYIG